MNRALYFGGLTLYLVPGAVTLAFQTVQVLIAAGSVVYTRDTVWPGNGWGYTVACLLSTVYFMRFGGVLEAPCPDGSFNTLFGTQVNYGLVFAVFSFGLIILILVDGLVLQRAQLYVLSPA